MSAAPSEDLKAVLARLADLQARMSSLEQTPARPASGMPSGMDAQLARQMVESQNLRDTMKVFEQQQARIYENFIGGASAFGEDIVAVLDKRLFPRLDAMFAGAKTAVADRMAVFTFGRFNESTEARLADFETRFAASIEQFSSVRENFERTEIRIIAASERMDAIWADQDARADGGWRMVMRAVSSYVDRGREPANPLEHFRGEEGVRPPSQPAIPNFWCPKCHQLEVRRLYRNTILEEALRVFLIAPYRCHACHSKFYRMRSSSSG